MPSSPADPPPQEEVFTAPLCLGGPTNPGRPHVSVVQPLLVEGSMVYASDVVFTMNNGVVVRYNFNGDKFGGKREGSTMGPPRGIPVGLVHF
jgi:hypothetical protein